MISDIASRLEDCTKDVNPDYNVVVPIRVDLDRLSSGEYEVPVDVEIDVGYWDGIVTQGHPIDQTGAIKTHSWKVCANHWHKILSGKTFVGEDGNILRVRRDQLHLLVARAVAEPYDTQGRQLPRLTKESMAFFFIDAGVLCQEAREEAIKQFNNKFKIDHVKKGDPIYLFREPKKRAIDQSTGFSTRLRTLRELTILEDIPDLMPEVDLILIDGLLYPPAIYFEDAVKTYKMLDEKGYKVCAIVKRPGSPIFATYLRKSGLMDISEDRYASDVPFLRAFLKPLYSTPPMSYEPYGKAFKKFLEKNWHVLYSYLMTHDGSVFRVEMPVKYQEEWEKIMSYVCSLSEANFGGLPTPLHISDGLCGFSRGEKLRIGGLLDSAFSRKGIDLSRSYGEMF